MKEPEWGHHLMECPDCGDRVKNALRILRKVVEEGDGIITEEVMDDCYGIDIKYSG